MFTLGEIPQKYMGREQAFIKHFVLKSYLVRLFMILGRHEPVINYVDCFAGPWKSQSDDLSDTSIGVSVEEMRKCLAGLRKDFGRNIKFRALYVEQDEKAFSKLKEFTERNTTNDISLYCMKGDFANLLSEIGSWCSDFFTFFFVDPLGWKTVSAEKLRPLLLLPRSEFLINFMYEFANRGFSQPDKFDKHMLEFFGRVIDLSSLTPYQRQLAIMDAYRYQLKLVFRSNAYSAFTRIERPGQDRLLYFLVYLTRHPLGIDVFKMEAQKASKLQNKVKSKKRLEKQLGRLDFDDLFGHEGIDQVAEMDDREDRIEEAKSEIFSLLSNGPLSLDWNIWARLLDKLDCFPFDIQLAAKELFAEGSIVNLDADPSRRRENVFVPSKKERWSLSGRYS